MTMPFYNKETQDKLNELQEFASETVEHSEFDLQLAELRTNHAFVPFTLGHFQNLQNNAKMYFTGLFGPGEIGIITGESGSCKTFGVIDLITAMVTQNDFAGFKNVAGKQLTVLYMGGEGMTRIFTRFESALHYYGKTVKDAERFINLLPAVVRGDKPDEILKFIKSQLALFEKYGIKYDVIFIDTLIYAQGELDENNNNHMNKLLDNLKAIQQMYNGSGLDAPTFALVTHSPKNGLTKVRGASSLKGAMDFVITFAHNASKNVGYMGCDKLKNDEQFKPIKFSLLKYLNSARIVFDLEAKEAFNREKYCKQKVAESCKKLQSGEWKKPKYFTDVIKASWPNGEEIPDDDYFSRLYKRLASESGDSSKMLLVRKDRQSEYAVNPSYIGFTEEKLSEVNDEYTEDEEE